MRTCFIVLLFLTTSTCVAEDFTLHSFEREQLSDTYFSEGAATGDINGDGVKDLIYGPYWFEGPSYEVKQGIDKPVPQNMDGYADNFFTWVHDVTGDDWNDVLIVGLPGTPAFVFENPKAAGLDAHWVKHKVMDGVGNESPQFVSIVGDEQPELVCAHDGFFGFATYDPEHPLDAWTFHPILEPKPVKMSTHGLGIGDVNGDKRLDVIHAHGWYEQPAENPETSRWKAHQVSFTQAYDASVLDAVMEEAAGLRSQVSESDRRRLEEYLESVREVERRIENAGKDRRLQGWRPTLETPDVDRPADGIPQDIDQHMRLMCDILVLAFRTDTTRVCTLKLNNDHSSLRFPNLISDRGPTQAIDYMIHHLLSHTNNGDWLKVNRFFTEQLAYIAGKLDSIQEGERTLLDNSMILYLSSMMTGNHNNDQLPVVMLGSGGGQIKTGRILDYLGKPNRKMCSLYLSMMDKVGVKLDRFGDSSERLADV